MTSAQHHTLLSGAIQSPRNGKRHFESAGLSATATASRPQQPDERGTIDYWRNRILQALLLVALVAGFFTVIPSVWLSIKEHIYLVALFDAMMYAAAIVVYFKKDLPYRVKATFLSILCFLMGALLLMVVGPFGGGGPVWLFVFPIVVAVLLGNRAAMIALGINCATLIAVGWAIHLGLIENWNTTAPNPMAKWIVISINFLFLNLMATLSLSTLVGGLRSALRYQNRLIDSLQKENENKKRALDWLHESEERYRHLFDEAPAMYVITRAINGEPIITDANNLCLSKLGYKREELIGQPLTRIYAETSKKMLYNNGLHHAMAGTLANEERTLVTASGEMLNTVIHALPVYGDSHQIKGTMIMYVDITERKMAEAHARKLEANLHKSQRIEAIGTLAGGIAHDFNNILAAILGYAELCKFQTPDTSPLYSKINTIYEAGTRARTLVKQILTFSRNNEKRLMPVDIAPLIKEVCKMLRASLPATIELKQQIQAPMPSIFADTTQIHQILMNLCTNAAHAMEKHGGTLQVSAQPVTLAEGDERLNPELTPGSYICLCVADDGCGVPDDVLPRIFEPYFTTKEQGEGTGLGLAVVHGIVKSYNGAVTVQSEPGRGTTMSVYLPTIEKGVDAVIATGPTTGQIPRGNEHILIVDDEPMVLDVAATMLGSLGYQVTTAGSAAQALEKFRAAPLTFDLLLLDMTMPKTNGDELAARFRTTRSDIPVILFTGYSKRLNQRDAESLGVDAILFKPIELAILGRTVREVFDRSSATPPTAISLPPEVPPHLTSIGPA